MHQSMKLSLGPILYNWSPEEKRDFYFQVAEEYPIDIVYIGEVICSKRLPFTLKYLEQIIERLTLSGKEVVLSTLALVMNEPELKQMQQLISKHPNVKVEVNDISALNQIEKSKEHVIGPYINVYNENTLNFLKANNADRVVFPFELPFDNIAEIHKHTQLEFEVQVFGRVPLAISSRCSHARVNDLTKSNCQFICANDMDGLVSKTIDGDELLCVNGLQTLSSTCINLAGQINHLKDIGVDIYRISPHYLDMLTISNIYYNIINNKISPQEGYTQINKLTNSYGIKCHDNFIIGKNIETIDK